MMHGIHGRLGSCGCRPDYEVWIVFFYDKQRTPGHTCDSAIFDVYVNGGIIGQINLNNSSRPPRPEIRSGGDVFGGEFHAADADHQLEIRLVCAGSSCHTSITTFMMIVLRRDGMYALLDNAAMNDLWSINLEELVYRYDYAKFYRQGEKVYVEKK